MRLPRVGSSALTIALWALGLLIAAYSVGVWLPLPSENFVVDVLLRHGLRVGTLVVFVVVVVRTRLARLEVAFVGLSLALVTIGSIVGRVLTQLGVTLPSPSPLDLLYVLSFPFLLAAFIVMLRRYPLPHSRTGWTVVADAAVAALGAGALLALVLQPIPGAVESRGAGAIAFGIVYPALDLLMVAGVGAVAASSAINLGRRSVFFVLGLLAFAAVDVIRLFLLNAGLYQPHDPLDALRGLGFGFFAWWAAGQSVSEEPRTRSSVTAVPILTATVLTALAVLVHATQVSVNLVAVIFAAAALGLATAPVILRQIDAGRRLAAQQELVNQLEDLDRARTQMLATVNHEIRTPLTSIRGYLELVMHGEAGEISEEAKQTLAIVDHNADRLALLVDDMLTMSRLDSGMTISERGPVDVTRLLYRVVASLQPFARARDVSLDIDEYDVEGIVIGDEVQLERAFTNITQNAVKFTPAGGVVGIELERDDANLIVRVIDTGIGIPESDMHLLFERFFRASNAQRDAVAGTGLGLAIVRGLIRAHRGDITIASKVDVGTTVRVSLPVADD